MATIVPRTSKDGKLTYLVRVRKKGVPPQTATFTKLSDARKWSQITEAAIVEGRHFKTAEAKRHTLADLIDRYICEILPHKSHSSIYNQTLQLHWWKAQLGHCILADITPALIAEYRDKLAYGNKGTGSVKWEWLPILKQSLIQIPVQFSRDPYVVEMPGRMGICMPYVVYPINSSRVLVRELFYIQIA